MFKLKNLFLIRLWNLPVRYGIMIPKLGLIRRIRLRILGRKGDPKYSRLLGARRIRSILLFRKICIRMLRKYIRFGENFFRN